MAHAGPRRLLLPCLAVLAAGLWIASLFLACGVMPVSGWGFGVGCGSVCVGETELGDVSAPQWFLRVAEEGPYLWPGREVGRGYETWHVPLWPAVVLTLWALIWSHRRAANR